MESISVNHVLEIAANLAGCLSFASYMSAFLTPRRFGRIFTAAAWAATFYAAAGLISAFFSSIPLDLYEWSILTFPALIAELFGITWLFYRPEPGKQLFLLCNGLAISGVFSIVYICLRLMFFDAEYFAKIESAPLFGGDITALTKAIHISFTLFSVAFPMLLAWLCVPKNFFYNGRRLWNIETFALILPCVPLIIIKSLLYSAEFVRSNGVSLVLASVFMMATVILSIRIVQRLTLQHMEERETAILREQVRALRLRDAESGWSEIRGMRHDLKNHLSTMRLLLKSTDPKSAPALQEYIGKMDETLDRSEFAFPTGHAVTDAVIHGQYLKATTESIKFTSEFAYPASFNADAYDLAVILQNALENAVEACGKLPEKQRFISVRSRVKADMFFVEVSNSYSGKIEFDSQTGLPVTKKRDTREHGWGISNIKRSAKKHHGEITIRLSEQDGVNVFILTAAMQGKTDTAGQS